MSYVGVTSRNIVWQPVLCCWYSTNHQSLRRFSQRKRPPSRHQDKSSIFGVPLFFSKEAVNAANLESYSPHKCIKVTQGGKDAAFSQDDEHLDFSAGKSNPPQGVFSATGQPDITEQNGSQVRTFNMLGGEQKFFQTYFRGRVLPAKKDRNNSQADTSTMRQDKRLRVKQYWYDKDYETPSVQKIHKGGSMFLKRIMMNEARKVSLGGQVNFEFWAASQQRAVKIGTRVKVRTLLRFLQAIAHVQLPITDDLKGLVGLIYKDSQSLKPLHKIHMFQALARLNWRDSRLLLELDDMVLCWNVLQNGAIIKAANSLTKLDLCSNAMAKPLRQSLKARLPYFTGRNCQALKAWTALTLFDQEMFCSFLQACESFKQYFRHYGRNLHIIGTYLRICQPGLHDQLPEAIKQFLKNYAQEFLKLQALASDCRMRTSNLESTEPITDICKRLASHGVTFSRDFPIGEGPFIGEICIHQSNVILELNREYVYYHNTKYPTLPARWRRHIIEKMGYNIQNIDEDWWVTASESEKNETIRGYFTQRYG